MEMVRLLLSRGADPKLATYSGKTVLGLTKQKDMLSFLTGKRSDNVRKYFDVKKRAFLCNNMHDFGRFYAKFLFVSLPRNNRCEICAFVVKIMRVFPI